MSDELMQLCTNCGWPMLVHDESGGCSFWLAFRGQYPDTETARRNYEAQVPGVWKG